MFPGISINVCGFVLGLFNFCFYFLRVSGLSISGFDFEFSSGSFESTHILFIERIGVVLCEVYGGVDSHKLLMFPSFLESAIGLFSKQHAEEAAQFAARDFVLPDEFYSADFDMLIESGGSIESLVEAKQLVARTDRFNSDRCHRWLAEDPEFDKLLELASTGAVVEVDSTFIPVPFPDRERPSHSTLMNCFKKHLYKLWSKGRGIVFPFDKLSESHLSGVHISPIHWTSKVDNDDGRFLVDLSNRSSGSDVGLEAAKLKYSSQLLLIFCRSGRLFLFE